MRSPQSQQGFTLIELVVVITILGILAAFAVPRFAALEVQARSATAQALVGSIRSSASLSHSLWLATGQPANVVIEGQTIAMPNGYPSLATIDNTLSDLTGFAYDEGTGIFLHDDATAECGLTYAEAAAPNAAPTITPDFDGC